MPVRRPSRTAISSSSHSQRSVFDAIFSTASRNTTIVPSFIAELRPSMKRSVRRIMHSSSGTSISVRGRTSMLSLMSTPAMSPTFEPLIWARSATLTPPTPWTLMLRGEVGLALGRSRN